MNRIFLSLIVTTFIFLFGNFILGLSLGDVTDRTATTTQQMKQLHFIGGVFTSVFVILVHCIVVTWFIGTSRWCKEVVETYRLSPDFAVRSTILKRKTFPYATICMLAIVGVAALGACSDPGAAMQVEPPYGLQWSTLHLLSALAVIVLVGFTFYIEWVNITGNSELVAEIMVEVRRIRKEHGLDVEDVTESESISADTELAQK